MFEVHAFEKVGHAKVSEQRPAREPGEPLPPGGELLELLHADGYGAGLSACEIGFRAA